MSSPPQSRRGSGSRPRSAGGRRHPWLRRIGLGVLTLVLLAVVGVFIAYKTIPIPKPNDLATAQASVVYYSDGTHEMDRISDINRQSVPLSKVPDSVQKALLAAEDRTFYENQGISPSGIARAVWVGLTGGQTQGGSTITQQYVKNYFLTQDRTVTRKAREILISLKIDGQLSKDKILENYLNTIYYGRGAYGIQTASRAYFGKDVGQLTPSQGALLASVIRGPSYYDPGLGAQQKQNAEGRWAYVMDGMVAKGWLTPAQRAAATFPATVTYKPARGVSGPMGYVVNEVKKELHDTLKLTDTDIDRGGLKIVTTIDRRAQAAAESAVKDKMPTGSGTGDLHVGLVSIKPKDGAIVAMYGGKDFQKVQYNTATDAKLQAGSTYKIFTLIAALQQQIGLTTTFPGYSPQYFPQFADPGAKTDAARSGRVSNFANEQFGDIDLRTATAHSVNTVFAPLNIRVTPARTTAAAIAAGLPAKGLKSNYANVFGTDTVTVKDMANAYATIDAQGAQAVPYLVKSVKGSIGSLDYRVKPTTKASIDKDVTRDTMDAMQQVVQHGTGTYALDLGRPAAGKTGTTTDNYSAWFDGFTPQLVTAVGIYKGDGSTVTKNQMNNVPGVGELTGGTVPVQIWTDYMKGALQGQPVLDFPPPANIQGAQIYPTAPPTSSFSTGAPPPPPSSSSSPTSSSPTSSSPTSSSPTSSSATSTSATSPPSPTSTTAPPPSTSTTPPPTTRPPTTRPAPTTTKPFPARVTRTEHP